MEILQLLFDNSAAIVVALISIISSVATIVTMFVDESKVNKYVKPVIDILNLIAGNKLKNSNKTDV